MVVLVRSVPVYHQTWHVYTSNGNYRPDMDGARWMWVAHGPRGSEAGCEHDPQEAVNRATAAAFLLSEPEPRRVK